MDEADDRGVPRLARGLLGDLLAVLRSTLALATHEARTSAEAVLRRLLVLAAALVAAAAGCVLLLGAAGWALGTALGSEAAGIAIVAVAALVAGVVTAVVVIPRIAREAFRFPATREQLDEDMKWFKGDPAETPNSSD